MEPISPELALVDPELARRARALLPVPALEAAREDPAVAPPSRGRRLRIRRDALVRVAASLAVPSIALNIALLRPEPATQAPTASTPAPARLTTTVAPAPTSGVEAAHHAARATPKRVRVAPARKTPAAHPRVASAKLRWHRVAKAASYDVILWRGHRRVADLWTTKPELAVAAIACRATKPLAAGRYLWFVYPFVDASSRRYGPLAKWGEVEIPAHMRCEPPAARAP